MQQKAVNFLIRLLLTSLFSGACSTPTTPAPIAPPTETEIPLPAPPTATPTDLTLPTMYVEPEVPIPIADPSAPLKLGGPWWMIVTNEGIWVMNADGSGLQEIKPEVPLDYLVTNKIDVAPSGGRIVFLAGTNLDTGLQLQLLTIPQNEFQTIATLIEPGIEFTPFDEPGSVGFEAMQAVMAINYLESYAWSPDGSLLGFMGMIAGPSSDLYTYDPESGEINQLTDGPSHGYRVSWSPDGKYILHAGVSGFGTGAGYSMAGGSRWIGSQGNQSAEFAGRFPDSWLDIQHHFRLLVFQRPLRREQHSQRKHRNRRTNRIMAWRILPIRMGSGFGRPACCDQ